MTSRRTLSLRIRNLDTDVLKVNDANGNPIEISAVITWQVQDAAQAAFDVEDYHGFVDIQAETAVRHVASVFPYDSYEEGQESLRGAADRVIATLQADLQERLDVAGVTVFDTRLRRLAYAPEIAADMLRRQQADAIVAARQRIVEGAVGMVDHALSSLNERDIVELTRSARRPWSPTSWSSWSATGGPNRWSTAAPSTPEPVHGGPQGLPPAHRPAPLRRPGALGGRRPAQRERPDRVPAAREPAPGRPPGHAVRGGGVRGTAGVVPRSIRGGRPPRVGPPGRGGRPGCG
jgi:hypothetical protein